MGHEGWASRGDLGAGVQDLRRLLDPGIVSGPVQNFHALSATRGGDTGGVAGITGPPGLPALDRTLLPKPCRDLWPDSASGMGGRELSGGQGSWVCIWGKGPTGSSHAVVGVGEGIWVSYLAVAFPPSFNNKTPFGS